MRLWLEKTRAKAVTLAGSAVSGKSDLPVSFRLGDGCDRLNQSRTVGRMSVLLASAAVRCP